MKITYIRLEKFKRFALRDADVFEHHFSRKLTMVTGANGAGKSSLFAELSPLPADKNHYHKGGRKEVHLCKDHKDYVLVSDFRDGVKYSFQCAGDELNPSGTVTIQRDLCAIHFAITPTLHDLLTGAEAFTEMGQASRKKLFNSITHLNIDSILKSYEALKEELRNNEYLVKSLQGRLLVEEQKLLDEGRKGQLQTRLQELQTQIDQLLDVHGQMRQHRAASGFEDAAQGYKEALSGLHGVYQSHLVRLSAYPANECDAEEARIKAELGHHADQLRTYYAQMEHLLHEQKSISFAQESSAQEIREQLTQIEGAQQRLTAHLKIVDLGCPNLPQVSAQLNLLEHSLPDILEGMAPNPDRLLSKNAYIAIVQEKNQLLERQHTLLKEHSEHQAALVQLQKHQALTCPSCEHTWMPHEVLGLLEQTATLLSENLRTRADAQAAIAQLVLQEETQGTYLGKLQQLTALYSSTKGVLGTLWSTVIDQELIYRNPSALSVLVAQGISEVIDVQKHQVLVTQHLQLEKHLAMVSLAGTTSHAENHNAIAALEVKIACAMQTSQNLRQKLQDVQTARGLHKKVQTLQGAVELSQRALHQANLKHLADAVTLEIDTQLSLHKVSVIETQNELGRHHAIEQGVKLLQEQLEDALQNVKVLTALTQELSPKNGFIAKSVSQFLNAIIGSINAVIAGVWDYKMVLKAIDVESDALNYRFKLEVEDRLTVDDVSKASAGMREIINLAMKVTLYKLLRLENYPMYLDEMASHLDSTHTKKIVNLIHSLTTSGRYSQVFLITHKEDFSFLKNTETIEL